MGEELYMWANTPAKLNYYYTNSMDFKKNLYIGLSVKCTCIPIFQFWWKESEYKRYKVSVV